MERVTPKTRKLVSVSGVILIGLSLVISSGLVIALLAFISWRGWDDFFDLMAIGILAIGVYYVSFGLLSFLVTRRAKQAMPAV